MNVALAPAKSNEIPLIENCARFGLGLLVQVTKYVRTFLASLDDGFKHLNRAKIVVEMGSLLT